MATAVTTGLVAAGLVLSGCGTTTTVAGTAVSDTTSPTTSTTAPTTTTAPRPTTTTTQPDPFSERLVAIVRDVDTVWETALHRTIDARMTEVGSVGCTGKPVRLAQVCTPPGGIPTLEWNRAGLSEAQREGTEVAVVLTLAHEYGHIVLGATGNSTNGAVEERRADCLAGAYLAVAGPKYGSSSDVLWDEAIPATRPPGASDKAEDVRTAAVNEGFKVRGSDPLGWCLANA